MKFPVAAITGLDHVDLRVSNIMDVWTDWNKLGFQIAPPSVNRTEGVASCAVAFQDGTYIAISGPIAKGEVFRHTVDAGVNAALLRVNNRDEAVTQAIAAGLTIKESFEFSRAIEVNGTDEQITFKLASILCPDEESDIQEIMLIEHVTPQWIWRDDMMAHANDAQGLQEVVVPCSHPESLQPLYARLLGDARVQLINGALRIDCGNAIIQYMRPENTGLERYAETAERPGRVVVYGSTGERTEDLPGQAGELKFASR